MTLNDALIQIVQTFVYDYQIPLKVDGKDIQKIELIQSDEETYFNITTDGGINENDNQNTK